MSLCPNCHDEATHGGMTLAQQRRYKDHPHNIRHRLVTGVLSFQDSFPILRIGDNILIQDGPVLMLEGRPVLSLSRNSDGGLELSCELNDETGRSLAVIDRNDWITGLDGIWDLDAKYRHVKLRAKRSNILLEIDARQTPIVLRGRLWHRHTSCVLGPKVLGFGGNHTAFAFTNITFVGAYLDLTAYQPQPDGTVQVGFTMSADRRFKWQSTDSHLRPGTSSADIERAVRDFGDLVARGLVAP